MEYLIIWLLLLLFSAIGAIITMVEKEVNIETVLSSIKEVTSQQIDVDQKAGDIIQILRRSGFTSIYRDSDGYIQAKLKKFSAGWFIFWSGFLLVIGSLIYISYYFGIKKSKYIKINVGKAPPKPKENPVERLDKLSKQFKNKTITEGEFNAQKEEILKEMKAMGISQ